MLEFIHLIMQLPQQPTFKRLKTSLGISFYLEGKQRCLSILKNKNTTNFISIQKNFFEKYGIIFVPFGPTTCSTYSKCWFGMLSCGQFYSRAFLKEYQSEIDKRLSSRIQNMEHSPPLPPRPIPKFLGWSIRSIHFKFRIIGSDILFPEVLYLPSPFQILFCSFALLI
jgi:hypothetical protein